MKALLPLLFFLLTTAALAQDAVFTTPKPFKITSTSPGETGFSGTAVLSGRFTAILEAPGEGDPRYIRVLFAPDSPSRAKLPHDKARGPVKELWLRNTTKALSSLIPRTKLETLQSGRVSELSGNAEILVGSFQTGVDCDVRGYSAVLISVARPATVVVASQSPRPQAGC